MKAETVPVDITTVDRMLIWSRRFDVPVRVRDVQRALSNAQRKDHEELVVVIGGQRWTAEELADLGRQLGPKALMPLDDERDRGELLNDKAHDRARAERDSKCDLDDDGELELDDSDGKLRSDNDLDDSKGEAALTRLLAKLDEALDAELSEVEPSRDGHQHPAEHRLRHGWHADRSLVQDVRALLRRWMSDAGETHDGPRVDWERGITRLLMGRDPRQVRREEVGTPKLAVLIDDSPSCGSFVTKAAPLATALMRTGAADVVAVHANGYDADVWVRGRFVREVRELTPDMLELRGVTHVLVLGDWDASELYRDLATTREVIWLDGWRARVIGEPFDATDQVRAQWGKRNAQRVRYIAGCGEPDHWVDALSIAIGKAR